MERLVIVMAKKPLLRKVKTRLAKSIGDHAAFWVYNKLLDKTIETVASSDWNTAIFFDSKPKNPNPYRKITKHILVQKGFNLGERLRNATLWGFDQGYQLVVVIGSDLWDINQKVLNEAFQSLENSDFVIGPTFDGGYYLMGMHFYLNSLFENISWSTCKVFEQTIHKLTDYKIKTLVKRNDIDCFKDLKNEKELYELYLLNHH